jgi:thiamine kinase-like enzyme
MIRSMNDTGDRIRALPLWKGSVDFEPLHGGLSNESYTVTDASGRYVVRFGRDLPFHHVFRDREIMITRAAHGAGFAPELVHAQPGIMVSRFIEGVTYDAARVRGNLDAIADTVRRFHLEMPKRVSGPAFMFWPFHVIRDYARTLRAGNSPAVHRLDGFLALADALEALQQPLPIVFGHHDFLPANFIDDGAKLWIIDYEYAGFSTAMFDLAGIASNAGASAEESAALLGRYFGAPPGKDLLRSHAAMQCASLLREAMWSMVSELHMDTPGVDYAAYAEDNLNALDAALDAYASRFDGGLPRP